MSGLIDPDKLKQIVEAALMASDEPLTVDRLTKLFAHGELAAEEGRAQIRETLKVLEAEAEGRGYELKRVASGYRYQVRQELSEWVSRLWEEKPPRYTRALLETLALIAYKQPVTRGDIEQVRGVSVSQNIMRTLQERGWIRAVGQREVPGKPSLYGTTREFLDYFDLKSLDQLPPLTEIRSLIEPLAEEEDGQARGDGSSHTESPDHAAEESNEQETRAEEVGRQVEDEQRAEDVGREAEEAGREAEDVGREAEEADHDHEGEEPGREAGQTDEEEPARAERAEGAGDPGDGEEAGEQAGGENADEEEPFPHSAEVVRLPTPRR